MIYVSWSVLYEGASDKRYFDILIPRLIEEILLEKGRVKFVVPEAPVVWFNRGSNESLAEQICRHEQSFFLVFIHSDLGGRNLAQNIGVRGGNVGAMAHELCGFDPSRCVLIAPMHEMEGWALADPDAVCRTLGFSGDPTKLGLPLTAREAERLVDPKAVLSTAANQARGRRKKIPAERLFPVIAQEQSLARLLQSASFRQFRQSIYEALKTLGSVN